MDYHHRKITLSIGYIYNHSNTCLHSIISQSKVSSWNLQSLFPPKFWNWLRGHAFDLCSSKLNGEKVILKYLAIQSTEWKIRNVPVFHICFQIYHRDYFLKSLLLLPLLHNARYCILRRRNKHRKTPAFQTWALSSVGSWETLSAVNFPGPPTLWPWVGDFLPETVPGVLHSIMAGQDVRGNSGFQKNGQCGHQAQND